MSLSTNVCSFLFYEQCDCELVLDVEPSSCMEKLSKLSKQYNVVN